MLSISQLCRCAQPLRAMQSKLVVSATRNGFSSSKMITRQLYTPMKSGNSNKIGFRIKELLKSNQIAVRLCASAPKPQTSKVVGYWLLGCSGMVFTAVVLGGVTRLTESGLSMVTWKLLGEKLPTTEEEWQREFEKYQQFPEFKYKNQNITLNEFKWIWWMEYAHRTWGRAIGACMFLPAAFFWARGYLDKAMKIRVGVYCALVAAQGLMGWYMVKSGLEDRFQGPSDVPRVSQYRLAAHLSLAFVLYSGLLAGALRVLRPFPAGGVVQKLKGLKGMTALAHTVKAMAFFTAVSGAFVAGLDAGLVYNSFPKMGDDWLPPDIMSFQPPVRNFTENPTTVQFDHRVLGTCTLIAATCCWLMARRAPLSPAARRVATAVGAMAWLQYSIASGKISLASVFLASGDIMDYSQPVRTFIENPTTVQFDHRVLGTCTLIAATCCWLMAKRAPLSPAARRVATAVGAMAWLQVSLGIATLLTYVPTPLAASHQSGSLLLLTLAIWLTHEIKLLKYIPK